MTGRFHNYDFTYKRNGKPVFSPSALSRKIGHDIKKRVEKAVDFESVFYHLQAGGHVSAMHAHRPNRLFAKIDLERFFYTVGRNRVVRALRSVQIDRAEFYGRWSCVRNPYASPSYALPYGFVQSPILATLALRDTDAGRVILDLSEKVTVSVYMDDISLSSNDFAALEDAFRHLSEALPASGFTINTAKTVDPSPAMDVFNCRLTQGKTNVLPERIELFRELDRTPASEDAFVRYCEAVKEGNTDDRQQAI